MTSLYSYDKDLNTDFETAESDLSLIEGVGHKVKESITAFSRYLKLTYISPYKTYIDENDRVFSDLFINKAKNSKLIILMHGFASSPDSLFNYYKFIGTAIKKGYNCAFLNLPYHLNRTPLHERSGYRLIYFDDCQTLEFYHQAVVDTKRLISIALEKLGMDEIMLCGFSLGSMVASITAAIDDRVSRSALVFGGGNWHEIHWNSMLSLVLKGNCLQVGQISRESCARIYRSFPDFLKNFKSADIGSIQLEEDFKGALGESIVKKCFLCDPLAFAHKLKPDKVLMLGSRLDHYFPKKSLMQFQKAAGMPQIKWFTKLHTSSILTDKKASGLIFDFFKDNCCL